MEKIESEFELCGYSLLLLREEEDSYFSLFCDGFALMDTFNFLNSKALFHNSKIDVDNVYIEVRTEKDSQPIVIGSDKVGSPIFETVDNKLLSEQTSLTKLIRQLEAVGSNYYVYQLDIVSDLYSIRIHDDSGFQLSVQICFDEFRQIIDGLLRLNFRIPRFQIEHIVGELYARQNEYILIVRDGSITARGDFEEVLKEIAILEIELGLK